MREGIYGQLFQRLGLRPKEHDKNDETKVISSAKVSGEEKPEHGLKRLNDFRLRQLSSGWTPGQAASAAGGAAQEGAGEGNASAVPQVMTPQMVAPPQTTASPANPAALSVAPWPAVSAEMQDNLAAFVQKQFSTEAQSEQKQA